jgi:hypothetical protein
MASNWQQSERLRKQCERQKDYRDRLRAERKPTRDDIVRVLLHYGLADQGFDKDASLGVIDDLIDKYTKRGWDFRRKVHLMPPGDADDPEQ